MHKLHNRQIFKKMFVWLLSSKNTESYISLHFCLSFKLHISSWIVNIGCIKVLSAAFLFKPSLLNQMEPTQSNEKNYLQDFPSNLIIHTISISNMQVWIFLYFTLSLIHSFCVKKSQQTVEQYSKYTIFSTESTCSSLLLKNKILECINIKFTI